MVNFHGHGRKILRCRQWQNQLNPGHSAAAIAMFLEKIWSDKVARGQDGFIQNINRFLAAFCQRN